MPILDETIERNSSLSAIVPSAVVDPTDLTARKSELADLRFEIILRARWEASDNVESERKVQLRDDLGQLRQRYSEKIDEIAMTFGVPQAMAAQADVEKNVTVPRGTKLPGNERTRAPRDIR